MTPGGPRTAESKEENGYARVLHAARYDGEGSGWTGPAGGIILAEAVFLFLHLFQGPVQPRTQSLPTGAHSQAGEACSGAATLSAVSGHEAGLGPVTSWFCTRR